MTEIIFKKVFFLFLEVSEYAMVWFMFYAIEEKFPYGERGVCNKIMPMFGRYLIDRRYVYFFKYTSCRNQSSNTRTLVWNTK